MWYFVSSACFIVCKPVFTMNLVEIVLTWRYTMINQFNLKIETLLSIFGLYLLITASRIECYWTILYLKHTFIWFYYSQSFKLFGFSNLSILSVPDEGYSWNTSCALNLISFYFLQNTKWCYRLSFVLYLFLHIQSDLYYEDTFGTKKTWSFKTGDLLKEVQFICNFLTEQEKGDLLIQVTA